MGESCKVNIVKKMALNRRRLLDAGIVKILP